MKNSIQAPVTVICHPLVRAKLLRLRDKNTSSVSFRRLVKEIAGLMAYEATKDLESKPATVSTPVAEYTGTTLDRPVIMVPILRAGLGFAEGMLEVIAEASLGHVGICRNEETAAPEAYYLKLPKHVATADVIVVDPMLATGGSAVDAINKLKEHGATRIRFVCLVSSQAGVERLQAAHPEVPIYTAEIDSILNEKFYIVPGLGDAGDRYFGT